MKRRSLFNSNKESLGLPSISSTIPSNMGSSSGGGGMIDGSGRGIKMDAPIVRNWKRSSKFTKGSYFWLVGSIFTMIWSYRYMMYHYATTYVSCEDDLCTLKIIPPDRTKKLTLKFHKDQIITTKQIKVTSNGIYVPDENDKDTKYNKKYNNNKYNDEKTFDSYGLIISQDGKEITELIDMEKEIQDQDLQEQEEDRKEQQRQRIANYHREALDKDHEEVMPAAERYGSAAITDPDLMAQFEKQRQRQIEKNEKNDNNDSKPTSSGGGNSRDYPRQNHKQKLLEIQAKKREKLQEHMKRYGSGETYYPRLDELYEWSEWLGNGKYMIIMRKYNIGHRKRRVGSLMRSIMNFVDGKRKRLVIRENRNVTWQGIVGIVFGMFSFLLCILIGQFWETDKRQNKRRLRATATSKGRVSLSSNKGARGNSIRKKHANHLYTQGPPIVPKSFPGSQQKQQNAKPKAYGGYVPGNSAY